MANEHPEPEIVKREIVNDPLNDPTLRDRWVTENPGHDPNDYNQWKADAVQATTKASSDGPTEFEQWALKAASDLVDEGLNTIKQLELSEQLRQSEASSATSATSESGKIAATLRDAFQAHVTSTPDPTVWTEAQSSARIWGDNLIGFLDTVSKQAASLINDGANQVSGSGWGPKTDPLAAWPQPLQELRNAVSGWQTLVASTGCPDRKDLKNKAGTCRDALGKMSDVVDASLSDLAKGALVLPSFTKPFDGLALQFKALGLEISRQLMSRREKPDFAEMFDRTGEFGQRETDASSRGANVNNVATDPSQLATLAWSTLSATADNIQSDQPNAAKTLRGMLRTDPMASTMVKNINTLEKQFGQDQPDKQKAGAALNEVMFTLTGYRNTIKNAKLPDKVTAVCLGPIEALQEYFQNRLLDVCGVEQ
jgi:hypothetical protein